MAENFDLIVIGAGSGARDGAARASRDHGARVALIERVRWGGSCPNVACRPTKAYLVAAELAYTVNELSDWMGVRCGPARSTSHASARGRTRFAARRRAGSRC